MIALCAALLAVAGPSDRRLTLAPGAQVFEKGQGAESVEAEGAVKAELLPAGEVLIEASSTPGLGYVFLFTRREVQVLEIAVGAPFPEKPAKPAECPVIRDAACYAKWRAAAQPGDRVVFEVEGLQAEARAAEAELASAGLPALKISLSSMGVRIAGVRNLPERNRALRAIWRAIIGPLRIDG